MKCALVRVPAEKNTDVAGGLMAQSRMKQKLKRAKVHEQKGELNQA
jgi:hypothetical protein